MTRGHTTVSLKAWELDKLRALYGVAWSYRDATYAKLSRALERATRDEEES